MRHKLDRQQLEFRMAMKWEKVLILIWNYEHYLLPQFLYYHFFRPVDPHYETCIVHLWFNFHKWGRYFCVWTCKGWVWKGLRHLGHVRSRSGEKEKDREMFILFVWELELLLLAYGALMRPNSVFLSWLLCSMVSAWCGSWMSQGTVSGSKLLHVGCGRYLIVFCLFLCLCGVPKSELHYGFSKWQRNSRAFTI